MRSKYERLQYGKLRRSKRALPVRSRSFDGNALLPQSPVKREIGPIGLGQHAPQNIDKS